MEHRVPVHRRVLRDRPEFPHGLLGHPFFLVCGSEEEPHLAVLRLCREHEQELADCVFVPVPVEIEKPELCPEVEVPVGELLQLLVLVDRLVDLLFHDEDPSETLPDDRVPRVELKGPLVPLLRLGMASHQLENAPGVDERPVERRVDRKRLVEVREGSIEFLLGGLEPSPVIVSEERLRVLPDQSGEVFVRAAEIPFLGVKSGEVDVCLLVVRVIGQRPGIQGNRFVLIARRGQDSREEISGAGMPLV